MGVYPLGIKAAHASMEIFKVQYSLHLTLLLSNAYPTKQSQQWKKIHVFKEGWFVHLNYMNGTKGQFTVIL